MSFEKHWETVIKSNIDNFIGAVFIAGWNEAIEEVADVLPCNRITCAVIDHETKHHFSCPQYWADEIRKKKV